jgi:hypothetical protein
MNKQTERMEYVDRYAEQLKVDNTLFVQQRMLIESQLQSSASFFSNAFAGQDFKREARKYLKQRGILR